MFSSPTAARVLKKQDPASLRKYDCRALRHLFLAGEPLDEPTHRWIADALGKPVIDHYWQTETGWPILTAVPGVEQTPIKFGSPSFPAYGYDLQLLRETDAAPMRRRREGRGHDRAAAAARVHVDGVGRRRALRENLLHERFAIEQVYSTFDWGIRDKDGYYFILGRTDDVINVAGHRLGTREIEEAVQAHPNVAEVAVVGVADPAQGADAARVRGGQGRLEGRDARGACRAGKGSDGHRRQAARRHRAARAGPFRDRCCRRRARASCCGARSRRSPRGAIRAISPRSKTRPRWSRSRAPSRAAAERGSGAGQSCSRADRTASPGGAAPFLSMD